MEEAKWTVFNVYKKRAQEDTEFIDNMDERMWTASKTAQIFIPPLIFLKCIFPKALLQMLINIYASSFVQLKKLYSILRDFFFPVPIYFISQESASAPPRGIHVSNDPRIWIIVYKSIIQRISVPGDFLL